MTQECKSECKFIKKAHAAIICVQLIAARLNSHLICLKQNTNSFLNTSLLFVQLGAITKLI